MDIKELIEKHRSEWTSDNFPDWKITEVMYCKLGWVIDAIDGSEELEEHTDILLAMQQFVQDLQGLEEKTE